MITSLGIMSGTSLDGLDLSLIKSDGEKKVIIKYNTTYKYSQEFKNEINFLINRINKEKIKNIFQDSYFKILEGRLNNFILDKILCFKKKYRIQNQSIKIIGLHGQTVFHNPKKKLSVQMGCGDFLAKKLSIPFVTNFRNADLLNGGQGAPLVPVFHNAIFFKNTLNTAVVNIGGISNISFIGKNGHIVSSDIGPGNTLIDQFCKKKYNIDYDDNGQLSLKGNVDNELLSSWIDYSFVKKKIPKSFDNFFFDIEKFIINKKISDYDFLATLTMFTSILIYKSQYFFRDPINRWIICGGGVHNKAIISNLRKQLKTVFTSDELGWDPNFIESQAFAYLAIRKVKNYYTTFPDTTGVSSATVGGEIFNP